MTEEAEQLATRLWSIARAQEQSAGRIPDDGVADEVRRRVRRLARADGVEVRTARLGDRVVVVRLDARVWDQDAATMRAKLAAE